MFALCPVRPKKQPEVIAQLQGSDLQEEEVESGVDAPVAEKALQGTVAQAKPTVGLPKTVAPKYYHEIAFLELDTFRCVCPSSINLPANSKALLKDLSRRLVPMACEKGMTQLNQAAPSVLQQLNVINCDNAKALVSLVFRRGNPKANEPPPESKMALAPLDTRPLTRGVVPRSVFIERTKSIPDYSKECKASAKDTVTLHLNDEIVFSKKPMHANQMMTINRRFNVGNRAVLKVFNTLLGLNHLGGTGLRPMWDEDDGPAEYFNIRAMPPMRLDLKDQLIVCGNGAVFQLSGGLEKVLLPRY